MAKRCWGKQSTRDNFQAGLILKDLAAGGEIGGEEAKRLLEEGCHAYIRLAEKLKSVNAHALAAATVTGKL